MKYPFGRSPEGPLPGDEDSSDEPPESGVAVGKPEFLQIRDQLIAEGEGPADIVFGPDLFDPAINETGAAYTDGLVGDDDGMIPENAIDLPVSKVFGTKDENVLLARMREHLSRIQSPTEQGPDGP